ncbi:hypothetical protein K503DRAFT_864427 [Rhizopogon vinicolor AM-OR11-026]|uniref:Uncharacterized protein n=1 Tax=Rhizopogon vinicolor AM-OR11-026 TaxID=1314800 RepID=A0A1B7N771_9AGAM|nr:hypothetical protein K503DRAFT_864427 [Rhizopogon vinicolor AM-OR11-026]
MPSTAHPRIPRRHVHQVPARMTTFPLPNPPMTPHTKNFISRLSSVPPLGPLLSFIPHPLSPIPLDELLEAEERMAAAYTQAHAEDMKQDSNDDIDMCVSIVTAQWDTIAAQTGFCDTENIPYENLADWLEYSGATAVCPAVMSCNATMAASIIPCVPQPSIDNGSCAEMVSQHQLRVTQGLFQNEYCVLASFCYAWSNTDVLLLREYPSYVPQIPTTIQEERLSEAVFYNMTGGATLTTQQNAIDAYYSALTGTWSSASGPFGAQTLEKTNYDGPYPTSNKYIIDLWGIIRA